MARGEGIKKLSSLFDKYKNSLIAPEKSVISSFQEVAKDLYNWDISDKHVSYSPYTKIISIKTSGPLKTEVYIHKKEILSHLKGRLGVKNAPEDII